MKTIYTSFLFCSLLVSCKQLDPAELVNKVLPDQNSNEDAGAPAIVSQLLTCEEARLVTLINLYREQNNLVALKVSPAAVLSTRWHAKDMIEKNYFNHTEPDGRTFDKRALFFNYPAWSENIAAGNSSANATFCQWKNSAAHNSNMLTEKHRSMGLGNATGGTYRSYWSNNFGPDTTDALSGPFDDDYTCTLPSALPKC